MMLAALTLGTAFPYLLFALGAAPDWRGLLLLASGLALAGGLMVLLFVPRGPFLREPAPFEPRTMFRIFHDRAFRLQAFGYFGHMWELYTLWAFVPVWLLAYVEYHQVELNVSLWSFLIVAMGFVGCDRPLPKNPRCIPSRYLRNAPESNPQHGRYFPYRCPGW